MVVGPITCGGVVIVLGTQLLSGGARACYPRHQGRGRCKAARRAVWQERWRDRRWSDWRCRRGHSTCAWNMSMTMGWMKTQTWSWAMQCACIYQGRQSKDNDTNWQQKETTITKDLQCMMTHAWASTTLTERSHVLQVSQGTSHIVGFHSLPHVINFNYCRCNYLLNSDLYANSL